MTAEYQRVLREWGARQLEERSDHTGPFTVTGVSLYMSEGYGSEATPSDTEVWATVSFTHDSCELRNYDGSPCRATSWSMMDTRTSVDMLNELLALNPKD